jgi:hypothetical protein
VVRRGRRMKENEGEGRRIECGGRKGGAGRMRERGGG